MDHLAWGTCQPCRLVLPLKGTSQTPKPFLGHLSQRFLPSLRTATKTCHNRDMVLGNGVGVEVMDG